MYELPFLERDWRRLLPLRIDEARLQQKSLSGGEIDGMGIARLRDHHEE
jgi:hypothetical protein